MLASITPLGERSRGFSWPQTASAFAVGAVIAATLTGAVAGGVGSLAPEGTWRSVAAIAVLLVALCFDATTLGRRLPSTRRQVNEDWMSRYRGWVYGSAYGVQLGVGLATVVTSAAIYAAGLGAALCGSLAAGAVVGAAFGVTRALSLLPARRARDPSGLMDLHSRMGRWDPTARWLAVSAEIVAVAVVMVGLT
jgi:hypothetical protein